MKVSVMAVTGKETSSVEVPDALFGVTPNVGLIHQVVTAQLAHKPWNQKGTGRARQGSIRSPQWRGGGIAHGPKPRDYSQRTPKKMVRAALCGALSDRAADGHIKVIDSWGIDAPSTKRGIEILSALGLRPANERRPRVLIVLDRAEHAVWKSFRNLGNRVQIAIPEEYQ